MKIGLLPLYLALYDEHAPAARPRLEAFYASVAERLERAGDTVIRTPFCRLAEEFSATVATLEAEGADVLMTLHMAYSPSLECIDALTATTLPIVVLDVTETLAFGPDTSPAQIMYNHGIHGVMDMCHMLHRRGVPFAVAAGHFDSSDAPERALGLARAAKAARSLSQTKTLAFGIPFVGMGDFLISDEEMKERFGVSVVRPDEKTVADAAIAVSEEELNAELSRDLARYQTNEGFDLTEYRDTVRAKLAVRALLVRENATAFTFNFNAKTGFPATPFLAASEAMRDGIGYAGEGDTLTASFLSALLPAYPEANFTEFFCPDWEMGTIFLSHMGECNLRVAEDTPVLCRVKTKYASPVNPYFTAVRMKGGKGVYVNISKQKDGFKLIVVEGEMLDVAKDSFPSSVRGWLHVGDSTASFLEKYSEAGGTHHGIFLYGATAKEMSFFAALLGMEAVIL